jgi:hypothetical protein
VGGSQQSQSTSLSTGAWTQPPEMFRAPGGYVLRIATTSGSRSIRISPSGIHMDDTAISEGAPRVELRQSETNSQPDLALERTIPAERPGVMKMGDMEMKPGEMRMGNMRMSMGSPRSDPAAPEAPPVMEQLHAQSPPQVLEEVLPQVLQAPHKGRFCTQCGERAEAEDKFCHSCGHKLRASSASST